MIFNGSYSNNREIKGLNSFEVDRSFGETFGIEIS
jgi:hypothetical protein